MKRKVLFLFFTIATMWGVCAQSVNGKLDNVILDEANKMGSYFLAKDYTAFAKYTHPATVELLGGREKMLEAVKQSFEALEAEGVTFLKIDFSEPTKIIMHENEMQCTLTQILELKIPGGTLTSYATMIAISRDGGKSWYFSDTAGNDITNMRKMIKTLSPKLIIPEPMEPAFVPDADEKQ